MPVHRIRNARIPTRALPIALIAFLAGLPAPATAREHPLLGASLTASQSLSTPQGVIRSGGRSKDRAGKAAAAVRGYRVDSADEPGGWIVLLEGPSLVERLSATGALPASGPQSTGQRLAGPERRRLMRSGEARTLVAELDAEFDAFTRRAEAELGRPLEVDARYRASLNGFATRMTEGEAKRLLKVPGVLRLERDRLLKKQTDVGPGWIGADDIWDGLPAAGSSRGAGVIVGIIDSGINWEHPSFADAGQGGLGYNHTNPLGETVGLCNDPDPEAPECNDKLIGVYDFVNDRENTEVEEEFNWGRDNGDHGSHVAGTVAGNPLNYNLFGSFSTISGVAPNANIISYRVCFAGDPDDEDDDSCYNSDIIEAIDQAIVDGVDVLNMSLGGGQSNPWTNLLSLAYLESLRAGIFTATSASNAGPADGTILNPANSPWLVSVGSATHNGQIGTRLRADQGGAAPRPGDLFGADLTQQDLAQARIVHARDYDFPLCGTGSFTFSSDCDAEESSSNPFPPGTFNGEIVVCDRGTYGRVEKGINLKLAGAGGYILANTDAEGEDVRLDQHCLPAAHLGDADGDTLRAWLDTEPDNHQASLQGVGRFEDDRLGDRLSSFSSRGPNLPPAEDVLKPNLIAPGDLIWAADNDSTAIVGKGGTSMSSPHVAGAAALLKGLHPDWTPDMIASALQTTATDEIATDENGVPATHHEVGHGRPRLARAADAGLYFPITSSAFTAANPDRGGDPGALNLPNLTEDNCGGVCTFERTVKALNGGGSWTASALDFPAGVAVTVTPSQFTLDPGGEQDLTIEVDLSEAGLFGGWIYGKVVLESSSAPDAVVPVTVFAAAGELPASWEIDSDQDGGTESFRLEGLVALPQATFVPGGLVAPDLLEVELEEDLTFSDPYDSDQGTVTVLVDVPEDALWLFTRLLSPEWGEEEDGYPDLDLFVGYDFNGDGEAQSNEEVCFSNAFPTTLEFCDIFQPIAGTWWVVAQNWESDGTGDNTGTDLAQLITAVIGGEANPSLGVAGPGMTEAGEDFDLDLSWSDVTALRDELLLGAVSVGTTRDKAGDVGVVPLFFSRTDLSTPSTLPLFDGFERQFTLRARARHGRIFIDVPEGASSLQVTLDSVEDGRGDDLRLRLYRRAFDEAFDEAPAAELAPSSGAVIDVSGSGGQGPSAAVSGSVLQPGRWYAVVNNRSDDQLGLRITAEIEYAGDAPKLMRPGLWESDSRPGLNQGMDYVQVGGFRSLVWYTYEQDREPVWYLAAGPGPAGNQWQASLERYTNDGSSQASDVVGRISVTMLGEDDAIFTWTLNGVSGSERIRPTVELSCDDTVTGIWSVLPEGVGGATVFANAQFQALARYLYDESGYPRWLLGAAPLSEGSMPLEQYSGNCPTCGGAAPSSQVVGQVTPDFDSFLEGSWDILYDLASPLSGAVDARENVLKLTEAPACP